MNNSKKTYNGWTNYETWAVALYIDNEESSYKFWRNRAQYLRDQDMSKEGAASALASELKSDLEDSMPEVEGLWADLLNAALSEVNWYELAKSRFDE